MLFAFCGGSEYTCRHSRGALRGQHRGRQPGACDGFRIGPARFDWLIAAITVVKNGNSFHLLSPAVPIDRPGRTIQPNAAIKDRKRGGLRGFLVSGGSGVCGGGSKCWALAGEGCWGGLRRGSAQTVVMPMSGFARRAIMRAADLAKGFDAGHGQIVGSAVGRDVIAFGALENSAQHVVDVGCLP